VSLFFCWLTVEQFIQEVAERCGITPPVKGQTAISAAASRQLLALPGSYVLPLFVSQAQSPTFHWSEDFPPQLHGILTPSDYRALIKQLNEFAHVANEGLAAEISRNNTHRWLSFVAGLTLVGILCYIPYWFHGRGKLQKIQEQFSGSIQDYIGEFNSSQSPNVQVVMRPYQNDSPWPPRVLTCLHHHVTSSSVGVTHCRLLWSGAPCATLHQVQLSRQWMHHFSPKLPKGPHPVPKGSVQTVAPRGTLMRNSVTAVGSVCDKAHAHVSMCPGHRMDGL